MTLRVFIAVLAALVVVSAVGLAIALVAAGDGDLTTTTVSETTR